MACEKAACDPSLETGGVMDCRHSTGSSLGHGEHGCIHWLAYMTLNSYLGTY